MMDFPIFCKCVADRKKLVLTYSAAHSVVVVSSRVKILGPWPKMKASRSPKACHRYEALDNDLEAAKKAVDVVAPVPAAPGNVDYIILHNTIYLSGKFQLL